MARLVQVRPVGVPQHIVQCGNNRQVGINSDENGQSIPEYEFNQCVSW